MDWDVIREIANAIISLVALIVSLFARKAAINGGKRNGQVGTR